MGESKNNITIKTSEDIKAMRIAGKLAADVLDMIKPFVKVGVTTNQLNDICHKYITEVQKAVPAPLGYRGFPKSICTSVNEEVCHGIPNDRKLEFGDIINIDITVKKDGYHGDTSKMFLIDIDDENSINRDSTNNANGTNGAIEKAKKLMRVTQECLYLGIKKVKPGANLEHIGAAIQLHAEKNGFSVVRDYCGHGIGKNFHEAPQVLHYKPQYLIKAKSKARNTIILKPGMIFTIEPMINAGKKETEEVPDNWKDNYIHAAITKDRSLSAQYEHTILVTETGFEILTKRLEEGSEI